MLGDLESIIEVHGRSAVTDPIALTGALRSLPQPVPDDQVAALAAAVGAGAVERLRATLAAGGTPADALRVATLAADPAGGERARWACVHLGAALGLLPRSWAAAPGAGSTADGPTAVLGDAGRTERIVPVPRRRRRTGLAVGAVAVALVVVVVAVLLALPGGTAGPDAAAPTTAPPTGAPPTGAPPTADTGPTASGPTAAPTASAAPTDPRAAFTDPALLAVAEPYLGGPEVSCEADAPGIDEQESVTCQLGPETAGIFKKLLTADALTTLRQVFIEPELNENAEPGSIRSTRWESVPGQPGVRTGVPAASGRPGEGTRVRWFDAVNGFPSLYFDEDATGVTVLLATFGNDDQQLLRDYWADPNS